ncbi:hypothetical protein CRG98_046943 [Punica granatum]|uniref:DUF4283 domain-containing protein n=1 Tax=Punica granatum TaxID=22663 RepID=A0A2I0HLW5_PUNGR|nr:hypothetical protein CRG98_046943 [Punica granatum]
MADSRKLKFHEPEVMNGKKAVKLPKSIIDVGVERWRNALVGQMIGQQHGLSKVYSIIIFMWGKKGGINILELENGLIQFDLPSAEVRDWVIRSGPWHIHHSPVILRPWKQHLQAIDFEKKKMPVWVQLVGVPLELMTYEGLGYIASGLGVPLCLDKATENVSKAHVARVCVEMEMSDEMPKEIPIILEDGVSLNIKVEYLGKNFPRGAQKADVKKRWVQKTMVGEEAISEKPTGGELRIVELEGNLEKGIVPAVEPMKATEAPVSPISEKVKSPIKNESEKTMIRAASNGPVKISGEKRERSCWKRGYWGSISS